ncbi:hypothetical protein K8I28_03290 [bacterium]|nr:hypothetical protein [bacterium]
MCRSYFEYKPELPLSQNEFKVLSWNGNQWNSFPISILSCRQFHDCLEVVNTSTTHSFIILVLDKEIDVDFVASIGIEGQYGLIFTTDSGLDQNISCNPINDGICTSKFRLVYVQRQSGIISFDDSLGNKFTKTVWNTSENMAGYVGLTLTIGAQVRIYDWFFC